jgi:NUMOD4 motif/HNH endonuclease
MWKDIDGFEGRYRVSDTGDILNVKKNTILSKKIDKNGYYEIGLRKLGDRKKYWFRVHRLVAIAFCEKGDDWQQLQIDHIDRNKQNNNASNLRWVTCQMNNSNRKDTCWNTNTTTGELYITKYKNGFMVRINRHDLKHRSWHHTIEDAINRRNSLKL